MLDDRYAERWSGGCDLILRLHGAVPRELEACLLDVSADGLALATGEELAVGDAVAVFLPPLAESVKHPETLAHLTPEPIQLATGRVVRTEKSAAGDHFVCGICFDNCDADRLEALIESMKNRSLGYAGEI